MKRFLPTLVIICSIAFSMLKFSFTANAQVTFTHTSNSDFLNGTVQNANITNNSVVPLQRMSGLASWESTTNLPQVLSGHKMAGWRNYVYCVGGYTGSAFVSTVYRATFQTAGISGWTTLTALPVSLRDAAVVCTQTQLVVIGGRNANGLSNTIYTAQFNTDGSIQAWKTSSVELPQAMFGIQATVVNDDIYLFGGSTSEQASGYSDKAYLLKVNALGVPTALTECTAMPQARCFHAVASNGNNIFVTGGMNTNGDKQNTVWRATVNNDGTLGAWQTMASLPNVLAQHTATCTNDIIALVGGIDNSGFASNRTIYAYTDGTNLSWQESDEFLSNRTMDAAACSYNNSILISGGVNMVGTTLANSVYMPILTSSAQVREAAFVSAPFVIGDPKNVQQLSFTLSNNTTDYQLLYRVAGMDKNFGSWILADQNNPTTLNVTTNYLQYKFIFNATTGVQPSLDDLTLTLSGITQLSGNLDSYDTLRAALSPYWATGSISFTSGTHAIEPGVVIMFSPNTGLDITRANVYFNGTEDDNITLTSYDHELPNWNGVYFQDASDNGVTSRLSYTTIQFAGNGDNNANLRLYNTNQPTIDHCLFNGADGYGVRLVNSHPTISSSSATNNTESGFYMEGSSPVMNGITSADNGFAGMYYANANVNPSLTDISLSGNQYGIYSYTPDVSFAQSAQISMSANTTDVALNGGTIASNRVWGYFPNGYALLGDVTIQGGSCPKLTIAPGNSVKVAEGRYIYIGGNSTTGGKLSAVGKADSLITFTALNGNIGGWGGLWFRDGSDYNSSSTLRYCVIEKGNDRNILCENTAQPYILNCVLQEAVNQNLRTNSSPITVESSTFRNAQCGWSINNCVPIILSDTFDNHSNYCVRLESNTAEPNFYSVVMKNSKIGFWLPNPNRDFYDYPAIHFSNNIANFALNGGDINADHSWTANSYAIMGNIRVVCFRCTSRLTIMPGATLKFDNNTGLQMGADYVGNNRFHGGALTAIGTPDSLITFTALNDSIGGWNGIYFDPYSDDYGSQISDLHYCKIEKGKDYNLRSSGTLMPSLEHSIIADAAMDGLQFDGQNEHALVDCDILNNGRYGVWVNNCNKNIESCTISGNASDGVWIQGGNSKIKDCAISENGRYPLHFSTANAIDSLQGLTFGNNAQEAICIDGGDINGRDRTFFNFGIPYIVMGNIRVVCCRCTSRLTIMPGTTLKFDNNTGLQMGADYVGNNRFHGGALTAIGTPDSLITFTALNDSIGGWNGIYFDPYSDDYGSQISDLHYCKIEKGKDYNLRSSGTLMPSLEHSIIANAAMDGLQFDEQNEHTLVDCDILDNGRYGVWINNCNKNIESCTISGNASDGVWIQGGNSKIKDCAISENGRYPLHFSTANAIDSLNNLTFSNNAQEAICIDGGDINGRDRTFFNFGIPYTIMGNIRVICFRCTSRLTIMPGTTLKFDNNTGLQMGADYVGGNRFHGGALTAIGTPDSLITFTALNDSIGGWNGIYFDPYSDDYGSQISDLHYCKIEKGNSYNLRTSGTKMPSLEHSIIAKALGDGLQFENEANFAIKNCEIRDNGRYGILLQGNAAPTIGGSPIDFNSFWNNGSYPIYNDGTSNINAKYNFWASADSIRVQDLIYDKNDNSSKGLINYMPFSWVPVQVGNNHTSIEGGLYYGESTFTNPVSLNAAKINDFSGNLLYQDNDPNGNDFHINNVNMLTAGVLDFEYDILSSNYAVNATDALLAMQHFAHIITLAPRQFDLADVNGNRVVNGTDAMLILKRYVNGTPFVLGDKILLCDTILFSDNTFNYDVNMLWYGDIDGSYTFSRGFSNEVTLQYDDQHPILSRDTVVNIPVIAKGNYNVGAISLSFNYPEELMDIRNVVLKSTGDTLSFHAEDGELRIGWYSLNPLALNFDDTLLTIVAHLDIDILTEPIQLTLNPYSELADNNAEAIPDVVLAIPILFENISGINDYTGAQDGSEEALWASTGFYPNPGNGAFVLADPNNIVRHIAVYDVSGRLLQEMTAEEANGHIDLSAFASGIYFLKLDSEQTSKTCKVVIEK